MGTTTGIEWTDHTFNPWIGCEEVSPECDHCYAREQSRRLGAQHHLKLWPGHSAGAEGRYFTGDTYWKKLAAWNRAAVRDHVRRKVFCASFADLFEERPELVDPRKRLFDAVIDAPMLDFLLLTKRPQNIAHMLPSYRSGGQGGLWPNVWLGTTAGIASSLHRAMELVRAPEAVVKFLSVEPMLGPLNLDPPVCPDCDGLEEAIGDDGATGFCPECETEMCFNSILDPLNGGISWVICGGESGPKARPMHPAWPRAIRDQCVDKHVSFFFKQWGQWHNGSRGDAPLEVVLNDGRHAADRIALGFGKPSDAHEWNALEPTVMANVGKKLAGRLLDGRVWNETPQPELDA